MLIQDVEALDNLSDDELWEAAANTRNETAIRQEAIGRWLFPGVTNPDASPAEEGGSRLRELERRATILESDEGNENEMEDAGEKAPYFDAEGRLILEHDGVFYLIESVEDEGAYEGISVKADVYTTDDKTNTDRDL